MASDSIEEYCENVRTQSLPVKSRNNQDLISLSQHLTRNMINDYATLKMINIFVVKTIGYA